LLRLISTITIVTVDASAKRGWTTVDLSGVPTDWQGVLDRIESDWFVKADAAGEQVPSSL
jgi:hypothetical protein